MPLAPNLEELHKKQPTTTKRSTTSKQSFGDECLMETQVATETSTHGDLSNGCSSIRLIGAGGAGKVAAIRYAKLKRTNVKITTIDTSGIPLEVEGIESLNIPGLNGSGKLRRENVEPITNFITDLTSKMELAEVNIIIASFSGGSGSLETSLLVDEILRQKKIAIVLGIIDTDSEIDTINAFNSLKTIENMVSNRKGYLPMVLFDNRLGRPTVDKGVDTILNNLTYILNTPFIGLDVQDRLKFLNPSVFESVNNGITLLNVSSLPSGDWEQDFGLVIPDENHDKLDAVMMICQQDNHLGVSKRCAVIFRGYFENTDTPRPSDTLIVSIGYQIPEDFIKGLNADIHAYRSIVSKPKTIINSEIEIGQTMQNGLVL